MDTFLGVQPYTAALWDLGSDRGGVGIAFHAQALAELGIWAKVR